MNDAKKQIQLAQQKMDALILQAEQYEAELFATKIRIKQQRELILEMKK